MRAMKRRKRAMKHFTLAARLGKHETWHLKRAGKFGKRAERRGKCAGRLGKRAAPRCSAGFWRGAAREAERKRVLSALECIDYQEGMK